MTTQAPRTGLIRDLEFRVTNTETTDDGLTLEGYAAPFDSPTEINSWEGAFIETIERGAFAKSISERKPVLMFNHGKHPMIGDMPIGALTAIREDNRGLFVRARLAKNWLVEPVREAIASKAVHGMSFRFNVIKDAWDKPANRGDLPRRRLLEVSCEELGPVVFPAYDDTSVNVRSKALVEALQDEDVRHDLAVALYAVEDTDGRPIDDDDVAPDGLPVDEARAASKAPYGDVKYADPGYQSDKKKRYPLDTKKHVTAAWDYINVSANADAYSAAQVVSIKGRIAVAAKAFGVTLDQSKLKGASSRPVEGDERAGDWTNADLYPILSDAVTDYVADCNDMQGSYCYLSDVSPDGWLTFRAPDEDGDGTMTLYKADYTVDESGNVTLGNPVEVVQKTTFIDATPDEADDTGQDGRSVTSDEAGSTTPEPQTHSDSNARRQAARRVAARVRLHGVKDNE
jgi:HK97 family phage prohead protease